MPALLSVASLAPSPPWGVCAYAHCWPLNPSRHVMKTIHQQPVEQTHADPGMRCVRCSQASGFNKAPASAIPLRGYEAALLRFVATSRSCLQSAAPIICFLQLLQVHGMPTLRPTCIHIGPGEALLCMHHTGHATAAKGGHSSIPGRAARAAEVGVPGAAHGTAGGSPGLGTGCMHTLAGPAGVSGP
jgi:hypothetical protein